MRKILLCFAIVLAFLLTACTPTTTVEDINNNPLKYMGKSVVVSGKVIAPLDVGSMSGFTLKANRSSIMVSSESTPKANSQVTVEGIVVRGVFTSRFIYAEKVR